MPYMQLRDNEGRPRIDIALDSDGTPHITLFDDKNVARVGVGVKDDDGAGISLFSSNAEHYIILGAENDGVIADFGNEIDEDEIADNGDG